MDDFEGMLRLADSRTIEALTAMGLRVGFFPQLRCELESRASLCVELGYQRNAESIWASLKRLESWERHDVLVARTLSKLLASLLPSAIAAHIVQFLIVIMNRNSDVFLAY
eukprot:TRINITY_DN18731_c0_g1_i1.p2 TRINITY_DN18731_c0_g1~~TRINITY_DN18731_c0_g1_i1.p2  ORF type:complete len:111 (+),score=19.44 TRINITY_DN18731_c0_g1_i1:438-770(+)